MVLEQLHVQVSMYLCIINVLFLHDSVSLGGWVSNSAEDSSVLMFVVSATLFVSEFTNVCSKPIPTSYSRVGYYYYMLIKIHTV